MRCAVHRMFGDAAFSSQEMPLITPVLLQEYCDGGTLLDAIKAQQFYDADKQSPRLAQVLPLLTQIASGLSFIHGKNIIHGDLKPDNVLLKTLNQASSPQAVTRPSCSVTTDQGKLVAKASHQPLCAVLNPQLISCCVQILPCS